MTAANASVAWPIEWLRITHAGTLSGRHIESLIAEIERLLVMLALHHSERGPLTGGIR